MASNQPALPLSAHRLFPAVVALWFAALLGLGFAVLPYAMIERLVGATGIASLIPAAAAPLGDTARLAIAVVAAVLGAIAGYALALRIAAIQAATRPAEVDARFFPVPGSRRAAAEGARRPLSVKDELGAGIDALVPTDSAQMAGRRRPLTIPEIEDWQPETPEPPFAQPVAEPEPEPVFEPEPVAPAIAEPAEDVEALPFAPPPLADDEQPEPELPPEPAPEPEAQRPVLPGDPDVDLASLGTVQLTERLGIALAQRLERGEGRPSGPPPAFLAELAGFDPEDFAEPVEPDAAIFGQATFEPAAPELPAALRPLSFELDSFGEDEDEEDEEEADETEAGYSSLLAIRPTMRPAGEAEPADLPAGETPAADPAETERALRDALASLQRASGAA